MTSAVHDVFTRLRVTVSKTVVKRKCYDYISKQILLWSVHPTWVYQNAAIIKTNTSVVSKFTYYLCNKVFDICEKFYYFATLGF